MRTQSSGPGGGGAGEHRPLLPLFLCRQGSGELPAPSGGSIPFVGEAGTLPGGGSPPGTPGAPSLTPCPPPWPSCGRRTLMKKWPTTCTFCKIPAGPGVSAVWAAGRHPGLSRKWSPWSRGFCQVATLKVWGRPPQEVQRLAVMGGSGGDFIQTAREKGAQVYITGRPAPPGPGRRLGRFCRPGGGSLCQ